ncbi:MAG: antibiotic biosynthesis monooxygenase [Desulfatibacillum sp.]|nr:antibiotic biosynthesis monooxygenase [Desulfatibacillum sp.]
MSDQSVKVVAHLKVKEDKIQELQDVLTRAIPATREENGCLQYDLCQNTADPTQFTFLEEWENNECLGAHLSAPAFKVLSGKLADLLAAAPDIRVYKLIM